MMPYNMDFTHHGFPASFHGHDLNDQSGQNHGPGPFFNHDGQGTAASNLSPVIGDKQAAASQQSEAVVPAPSNINNDRQNFIGKVSPIKRQDMYGNYY
jgi:hypothetical protein